MTRLILLKLCTGGTFSDDSCMLKNNEIEAQLHDIGRSSGPSLRLADSHENSDKIDSRVFYNEREVRQS